MAVKEKKIARTAAPAALPKGWRVVRFDEMAQLVNDRVDNPSEAGVERYVGLEHLDPESLKIRRWGAPTDVEAQKLRFQPGDIIFGKRRAYQRKVAVADFEGICSAHAMVLRAREETVVKDFLPFFMQSNTFFERALAISVGSLSPTINWSTLAGQEFVIPPEAKQRQIADILKAVDKVIETWSAVLDSIKQTYLQISGSLFKQNASKYGTVALGQAAPIRGGKRLPKGTSFASVKTQYPYIRVVDFKNLSVDVSNLQYLTPEIQKTIHRYIINSDDVYISIAGTVGIVGVVPDELSGANLTENAARLIIKDKELFDKHYIMYFLASQEGQELIASRTMTTTQPKLALARAETIPIPHAPIDIQRYVVKKLATLHRSIDKTNEHLHSCQSLKTRLLRNYVQ